MYVIKNGTIHTGTGEVLENYDILIEGKKIKKIEYLRSRCRNYRCNRKTSFPWFHRSTFFYRSYGDSDSLQR